MKNLKIGGLWCEGVHRGAKNGQYTAQFRQDEATLRRLEAIDWTHPEIKGECILPTGYGYDLVDIRYIHSSKTWEVTVKVADQYLGDVTGYVAQVKELEATNQEQAGEIARAGAALDKATREAETKAAQVVDLTSAVTQVAAISTELPDRLALSIQAAAPNAFRRWEDVLEEGQELAQGRIIDKDGQLYHVEQAVTPQAHQVPGGEGMLAIYRPIVTGHDGTVDDPIPWVYGMDCDNGLYYSYEGATYKCVGDMKPCVWTPGSPGVYQWEKVE